MKTTLSILLIALLIAGCNNQAKRENVELKAQLEELAEENAALAAGDMELELELEAFRAMLNEIDENIALIDTKSQTVSGLTEASAGDVEEDILLHLEHIHGTMANTKHRVGQLQENLDELYLDESVDQELILELEDALDQAAEEIIARDEAIDMLNDAVVEEDIEIEVLAEAYNEQADISEMLYDALNTGYVAIGTKKELTEYGIIDKQGGFIGLGRTKSLAADADDEWFMPVPMDETNEIDLLCKKAKLLTPHPESSYELVGDKTLEILAILDPAAFWDKSDFLVIEIVRQD